MSFIIRPIRRSVMSVKQPSYNLIEGRAFTLQVTWLSGVTTAILACRQSFLADHAQNFPWVIIHVWSFTLRLMNKGLRFYICLFVDLFNSLLGICWQASAVLIRISMCVWRRVSDQTWMITHGKFCAWSAKNESLHARMAVVTPDSHVTWRVKARSSSKVNDARLTLTEWLCNRLNENWHANVLVYTELWWRSERTMSASGKVFAD